MSMKVNHQLPLPADLKAEFPLFPSLVSIKAKRDA